MKKLLLLAGAALTALTMAACADSTTAPAPSKVAPTKASHDLECRSGYVVAYDQDGNAYCAPE